MPAHIHIMSGLGSSWLPSLRSGTLALEKLIDSIKGEDAKHHIWNDWRDIVKSVTATSPKKHEPIALIGHSNGVKGAMLAAEELSGRGYLVHYIAAIDPTAASFPLVGNNVLQVDEFWASSGWPAFIRRITRGRNGQCNFVHGWSGAHTLKKYGSSHVALASHSAVHRAILKSIRTMIEDYQK